MSSRWSIVCDLIGWAVALSYYTAPLSTFIKCLLRLGYLKRKTRFPQWWTNYGRRGNRVIFVEVMETWSFFLVVYVFLKKSVCLNATDWLCVMCKSVEAKMRIFRDLKIFVRWFEVIYVGINCFMYFFFVSEDADLTYFIFNGVNKWRVRWCKNQSHSRKSRTK